MKRPARSTFKKPRLVNSLYRSRLEQRIADQLTKAGVPFDYESKTIKYTVPSREARYTGDFFPKNASPIVIEGKGYFRDAKEREKFILLKAQHPDMDLRIVFQNAKLPIYKGSPTTYAMWAETNGIMWADGGVIPDSWIKEMKDAQKV